MLRPALIPAVVKTWLGYLAPDLAAAGSHSLILLNPRLESASNGTPAKFINMAFVLSGTGYAGKPVRLSF